METKRKKTKLVAALLALAGLLVFSMFAVGGSLQPSAPPNPTMKTLDEVEPRTPVQSLSGDANAVYIISQSGSYYLTQDITVADPNKNGITVEANDVTIDLMGYQIAGPNSVAKAGIGMSGRTNVEIRNGTIRNFGGAGIAEGDFTNGRGHRVIGMRVLSNYNGIYLMGTGHVVENCIVANNRSEGIHANFECRIVSNHIRANQAAGFGGGIFITSDCLVKNNTLIDNEPDNVYVNGGGNALEENLLNDSATGINFVGGGNFYANNRASGNGTDYADPGGNTDGGGNASF